MFTPLGIEVKIAANTLPSLPKRLLSPLMLDPYNASRCRFDVVGRGYHPEHPLGSLDRPLIVWLKRPDPFYP